MEKGFVYVTDVIDNCILEIRYYSSYNFVGERIDGYNKPFAILSVESCVALKKASDYFNSLGYIIKIYDCYRPQKAVDHFVRWANDVNDIKMKDVFYPNIDKSRLFIDGFISKNSGHSRGSTVDLTLVSRKTGKELDMGGVFDYFGELSHSDYEGITKEQYNNRMILRDGMIKNGFRGIRSEWWHFTLVDEPYKDKYFNFNIE